VKWYRLDFPKDLDAADVLRFTRSLTSRRRRGLTGTASPVVFEVEALGTRIEWFMGLTDHEDTLIRSGLGHSLPNVRMTAVERRYPTLESGIELRLNELRRPLRTDVAPEAARALLGVTQSLRPNEAMIVHWLVGPWLRRHVVRPVPARRKQETGLPLELAQVVTDNEQAKALREKQQEPLFGVVGRIAVRAAVVRRERQLLWQALGALQLVRQPGVGFRRRLIRLRRVPRRLRQLQQPWIAYPNVLNASELASVLGWPIDGPSLAGVTYNGHRQLPPPPAALIKSDDGKQRITGRTTYPGAEGLLRLQPSDGLRHFHVIGPSGVGKSTLLGNLLLRDIEAGRGAVLLDPKGDLVNDVLERIPEHRLDDIVLLDPADNEHAVGFNPLAGTDDELAVDGVLHVLRSLYAAYWGPRSQDIFHAGLLTLAKHPGFTLCDLPALLTNATLRRQLTATVRDDASELGAFWQWYDQLSEAERPIVAGPVLNKLRAFTMRRAIRGVIGSSQGFDLKRILTERKVLLVNLSTGSLGAETAYLLGALLLSQLWHVLQSRSTIPVEERHPVFLVLDEFQRYLRLPVDIGDALVTARGLGVGLVLAHQHLGQLGPEIRSAVMSNAASRVVFQTGHDDATTLAKTLGNGLTANDLRSLGAYETYQTLCVNGATAAAASAETLPLPAPTGVAAAVRQHSAEVFAMRRVDVDAEIAARRQAKGVNDVPIGVKRRPRRAS
jgi:hypothetical protein